MRRAVSSLDVILFIAGFVVWSLAFVSLYGLQGAGCALGWDRIALGPSNVLRVSLLATWCVYVAAAATLAAWTMARRRGPEPVFLRTAGMVLSLAALVATVGSGAPILVATMCG